MNNILLGIWGFSTLVIGYSVLKIQYGIRQHQNVIEGWYSDNKDLIQKLGQVSDDVYYIILDLEKLSKRK